jgi:hypothetical protein
MDEQKAPIVPYDWAFVFLGLTTEHYSAKKMISTQH